LNGNVVGENPLCASHCIDASGPIGALCFGAVSLLPPDAIWFTEPIERPMLGSPSAKLHWKGRFPLWRTLVFECRVRLRRGASAKSPCPV